MFRPWRFGHDAFAELTALRRTEISVDADGYRLKPHAPIDAVGLSGAGAISDPLDLRERVRPEKQVIASFSHDQVFEHRVQIPANAAKRIGDILKLEIGRVTPFSEDQVLSGWFAAPLRLNGAQTETLEIHHVILRRDLVTRLSGFLESAGITLAGIFVRGPEGQALPISWSANGNPFGIDSFRFHIKILFALVGAALIAGLGLAWGVSSKGSKISAAIQQKAASISMDVDAVKTHLEKLKEGSAALSSLRARKLETTSITETVANLTKLLPDGASLTSLTLHGTKFDIEGLALEPERLISDLETSPYFKNVVFSAPVTRNANERASRFAIRAEFEPKLRDGAG